MRPLMKKSVRRIPVVDARRYFTCARHPASHHFGLSSNDHQALAAMIKH
jgi:hypothetical protein